MIKIRVDDFPNTKDDEKDKHSLAAFRRFHNALGDCIGWRRYLLGVIPKRCTIDDVLFIRNETDVEIGMHGIYHDEAKLDIYKNEFPPYMTQQDIGRWLLETSDAMDQGFGRRTEVYMPPRNLIDARTRDVLLECGFIGYTTGPETAPELRSSDELTVLHSQPPYEYGRTDELLKGNAHEHLMRESDAGRDVILTLHWTWETNIGLERMREFFSKIPTKYFKDFF